MVILRNGIVYSLRMVMPNDDISGSVNERLNKPRSSRKQDIVGQLIQLQGGIWQS